MADIDIAVHVAPHVLSIEIEGSTVSSKQVQVQEQPVDIERYRQVKVL